jgi:hypothetical protein
LEGWSQVVVAIGVMELVTSLDDLCNY